MFKVFKTNGGESSLKIQGAKSQDNNADISSLIFQNYDDDTHTISNLA